MPLLQFADGTVATNHRTEARARGFHAEVAHGVPPIAALLREENEEEEEEAGGGGGGGGARNSAAGGVSARGASGQL